MRRITLFVVLVVMGCGPGSGPPDGGSADLSVSTDSGSGPQAPDLAPPRLLPGDIGAACTTTSDCTVVKTNAVCFYNYLFNSALFQPTPGGYCSATCNSDADCGHNGACYDFGSAGAYCLARCNSATFCRHPGYACMLGDNICFPDGNLDCDPTVPGGACQATVDPDPNQPKVAGGCLRDAYEDRGHCAPKCTIAAPPAPPDDCKVSAQGDFQNCNYLDTTVDVMLKPTADKWKGLICLPAQMPPAKDRQLCQFFEDCIQGDECNLFPGGDGRCHPLCIQGGTPACQAGYTCKDAFHAGSGGPGLCL